ncbi:phytanoyl-CoA dioxygenase [Gossypium australe]|uniref:Phytanoyl-CoA dioxygenase n=1 Tax=Gossypium australe TaxID=47621 RepID=A0A5B6V9V3_9ROSI|nr:phytanoyl-CoA dioxygenase [Gossypium australe]
MGIVGNLTPQQRQAFDSQGFLVIESFASPAEIEAMRKRMDGMLQAFDPTTTASIFSTKNQVKLTSEYFYESAEKISFFFEDCQLYVVKFDSFLLLHLFFFVLFVVLAEKAFDDNGNLKQPKELSINKVGHALHEIDPVFKEFSCSEKVSSLLFSLGYKKPVIIQSMYIFKSVRILRDLAIAALLLTCSGMKFSIKIRNFYVSEVLFAGYVVFAGAVCSHGIGGEVTPHQDNSFLYTEPKTCTDGLVRRFIRGDDGVYFDRPSPSYDQKGFVPIEVKAGSLVVIHGDLIHQSFENQSSNSRHAYSLHAVDTDGCKWAEDNWIRRKVKPEPLYASGQT